MAVSLFSSLFLLNICSTWYHTRGKGGGRGLSLLQSISWLEEEEEDEKEGKTELDSPDKMCFFPANILELLVS